MTAINRRDFLPTADVPDPYIPLLAATTNTLTRYGRSYRKKTVPDSVLAPCALCI